MRRVLVIDDHVPSRDNLKRALAAGGCQVVGEGTSGKGAAQLASATVPDVILMAVGLSDLDGIRAARKIMQARPVPVILVSSHYDAETVERAKLAGVMGYLLKPLRDGELLPTIEIAVCSFPRVCCPPKRKRESQEDLRGAQDHRARERDIDEKQRTFRGGSLFLNSEKEHGIA